MNYNNDKVRRQDRLLGESEAYALLQRGEYGYLSLVSETGSAYGIPVSYAWDRENHIYIHCAPEGKKLRYLAQCVDVSFCVVGHTRVLPGKFTTEYESIILHCRASIGLSPEERMHAIRLILEKYSPDHLETGMNYAAKSFHRTEIIRLDIVEASGKNKRMTRS